VVARNVAAVTAEAFSSGMVRALQDRDLSAFRGRMLAADGFVLEEAHRLRGKPRTQREVLTVLRYHIERGRPVVVTSRHPPNAIFLLDEALRSYFLSGILLRIPDYATPSRASILEAAAARFARPVPRETILRIAERVQGSFDRQCRFLEKVAAFAGLSNCDATPQFLAEKFPEIAGSGEREVDLDQLVDRVAHEFGTTRADVASNRKTRTAVLARHVVVFLASEVFALSARRIVRHLGGLSPSTTAYARRKIERRRKEDAVFDARLRRIMDEVRTGQRMLF
jgi:chromosomal replication initiator protein